MEKQETENWNGHNWETDGGKGNTQAIIAYYNSAVMCWNRLRSVVSCTDTYAFNLTLIAILWGQYQYKVRGNTHIELRDTNAYPKSYDSL